MRETRDLEQVLRLDGRGCFVEIMLSGLPFDRVLLNFCQYDPSQIAGARQTGSVGIFLDIYDAQVLAGDILSGKISALGKKSKAKAAAAGSKYPDKVYESLGGTPAKRAPNGVAVGRVFQILPGASQPWILCAKQGPGHETKEGLIVLDKPETTIRVPMSNVNLKKVAYALQTCGRVWEINRFVPVIKPAMQQAQARRQEAIDQVKAASAAAANTTAQYGTR